MKRIAKLLDGNYGLLIYTLVCVLAISAISGCTTTEEDNERKKVEAKAHNDEAIKSPEFMGCLPDGRALFRINFKGPDNWSKDRIYITLDGQATAAMARRHGKSTRHESVAWPNANQPADPAVVDPCYAMNAKQEVAP